MNKYNLKLAIAYIKPAMLAIAIYDLEFISDIFMPEDKKAGFGITDHFFFTNLSLYMVFICVLSGYLRNRQKTIASLHILTLPVALILELIVTKLFWTLFFIDWRLVKRRKTAATGILYYCNEFPRHLFPLAIMVIEYLNFRIKKSKKHMVLLATFTILYFTLLELLRIKYDIQLYRFLAIMSPLQRFFTFLALFFYSVFIYQLIA